MGVPGEILGVPGKWRSRGDNGGTRGRYWGPGKGGRGAGGGGTVRSAGRHDGVPRWGTGCRGVPGGSGSHSPPAAVPAAAAAAAVPGAGAGRGHRAAAGGGRGGGGGALRARGLHHGTVTHPAPP